MECRGSVLSGHQNVGAVRQRFETYRAAKDEKDEADYLATFYERMWDLSAFMKLLKQRFTQWYNGRTAPKGTLWEERLKSVLVEGAWNTEKVGVRWGTGHADYPPDAT